VKVYRLCLMVASCWLYLTSPIAAQEIESQRITVENAADLVLLHILPFPPPRYDFSSVADFIFTPDGEHLLVAQQGVTRLMRIPDGEIVAETLAFGDFYRNPLAFSQDGSLVIVPLRSTTFCIWNMQTESEPYCDSPSLTLPEAQSYQEIQAAALSTDNRLLYVVSNSQFSSIGALLHVFDVTAKREIDRLQFECGARFAEFNQDGSVLVCSGSFGFNVYAIVEPFDLEPLWSTENRTDQAIWDQNTGLIYTHSFGKTPDQSYRSFLESIDIMTGAIVSRQAVSTDEYLPFFAFVNYDGRLRFREFVYDDVPVGLVDGFTGEMVFDPGADPPTALHCSL
jgi:WD40 repeat protein